MEGLFANTMMARAEGDTILSLPTSRVVRIDGILARDVPEGGSPDLVGTTPIQGFRGGRALLNAGMSRIETRCERNGQSLVQLIFSEDPDRELDYERLAHCRIGYPHQNRFRGGARREKISCGYRLFTYPREQPPAAPPTRSNYRRPGCVDRSATSHRYFSTGAHRPSRP